MADKELSKIRKLFIESVSLPTIKDFLDDLEGDKVLTAGESASVTEDNTSRADRARSLIDMVKRKGNKASEKMMAHLKTRDPELFFKLQPAVPSLPQQEQSRPMSSDLIPCTDEFWTEKRRNEKIIYPVIDRSIRTRLALLITNIEFDNKSLRRRGAEKDEENMEKLLKELGYKVVKHSNLSAQEIDNAVKGFSKHPDLSQTDSVFVVIMSHGILGAVLGVHWNRSDPEGSRDEFPIDNIFKHLNTLNCPALKDKPKVIIIQACRGDSDGSVWVNDTPGDDPTPALTSETPSQPAPTSATDVEDFEDDALVHIEKDFISLLSCTPDTLSYRRREHGSLLIQFIIEIFNNFACEQHVEDLFTKVMNRFEDFNIRRQMPTKDRCTFTKYFYLFPGH